MTAHDTAFQFAAANLRFGSGITREVGDDLTDLGVKRTLLLIDPALRDTQSAEIVFASLKAARVEFAVYDQISVEPTDASFREAASFARSGRFDSFLALGGGSTIDTAKAANLYATHEADFFDFVNAPIGKGLPVPGPVKPLIAIPTTAGTGSETTGVAIFDYVDKRAKTGISHRYLKPTLGIIDMDNTRTMPAAVAAATGLDVLSHALESYTAIPYTARPKPARPLERPAYQGCNPISDVWAIRAGAGRRIPRSRCGRHRRRGSAGQYAAGLSHCRDGFWKRRLSFAPRHVIPRRRDGEGLSAARLSRRPRACASRRLRDSPYARGGPLHGFVVSGTTFARAARALGANIEGVPP